MNTYSGGYCWYYWEYYRNKVELTHVVVGHELTPKTLYVTRKYSSYKEELLHHFSYNIYKKFILNKAIKKMTTTVARSMCTKEIRQRKEMGMQWVQPVTTEHLMSVIAYCDMDTYSTKFSSTFRKLKPEETFQSVKQRNREYWWQSKLLKEIVTCYGSSSHNNLGVAAVQNAGFMVNDEIKYEMQNMNNIAESGPFCMLYLSFPCICVTYCVI